MTTFRENKKFLADIERRVIRALKTTGESGRDIAKPLTPVDTSFAQKSVHSVVYNKGQQVAGDTADENGNSVPLYNVTDMPTVFVGSNTEPRPDQFTGGGGYYVGLEMGVYSRKGSNMLAAAFSVMQDEIMDNIRDEMK